MAGCGSSEAPARESAIGRTCSVRPKVVNIMDALKKSMQTGGQAKVRDAVRVRVGNKSYSPYKGCHSWALPCQAVAGPKGRNTLFCYPLLPLQAHWARERLKPSSFWRMAHDRPSSRRRSTWRIGGPEPFQGLDVFLGDFAPGTGSVELDLLQRALPSIFVYAGQRSHVGAAFQVLTPV